MVPLRFFFLSTLLLLARSSFAEPAPQLVALDALLARTQEDHRQGRLEAKAYGDAIAAFRTDLAATVSRLEGSSDNAALHARILSRLGEPKGAFAALGPALAREPDDAGLRVALSRVLLEQKNYRAALAEANAVLEGDPRNKEALAIKFESEGRADPSRAAASVQGPGAGGAAAAEPGAAVVVPRARGPRPNVVPPPDGSQPTPPDSESGGLPLWPVLPAAGLSVAAFAVRRSRMTVESEEGFNEDDRPQPGRLQEFVAGSVLAGLAGAAVYLGGVYVVAAASPLANRFMAGPGQQAMRLAQSQTGAINPRSASATGQVTPQTKAAIEESAAVLEQIVIRKGEYLNRVWDSRWPSGSVSGPQGLSYCRGSCLPINSATAVQRRGLSGIAEVTNNAREGAIFRVKEDIIVSVRKSIGGVDQEIIIRQSDVGKLQEMATSTLPPGIK